MFNEVIDMWIVSAQEYDEIIEESRKYDSFEHVKTELGAHFCVDTLVDNLLIARAIYIKDEEPIFYFLECRKKQKHG